MRWMSGGQWKWNLDICNQQGVRMPTVVGAVMSLFRAIQRRQGPDAGLSNSRSRMFSSHPSTLRGFSHYGILLMLAAGSGGLMVFTDVASSQELDQAEGSGEGVNKKKVVVLGTGWAGTSFLKNLDCSKYDVQVISPRNYFAFTPLLPSVTCGTVEARSISEPIRKIVKHKKEDVRYWEAECLQIDARNKNILCRSNIDISKEKDEFALDYDFLIIAVGARVNTFNTPGVVEHCHFLKEVEDAQKIRGSIVDCFERASLPHISNEEREKILHFVVVGGGPTGIEFAAELHDFVHEDLLKLYPSMKDFVKITVIQSGDHILNMFDQRISNFAEKKFQRDGIEVKTGCHVMEVTDEYIKMKEKSSGKALSMSYGMIVWSTGIGTRPVVSQFMGQIGQMDRRVLATDEWLRVKGCNDVYALGDCATIEQRKIMEDISYIFKVADKDNSGTLTVEEFLDVLKDIRMRYPQIDIYMERQNMSNVTKLLEGAAESGHGKTKELDIEHFKSALSHVDSQMKTLPATAQVAAQQGAYLAHCFDQMDECEVEPEGPLRFRGSGRHRFRPFKYKHFGQFAPLGGEQAAAELPGDWVSIGHSTQWLWYSVYASKQVSWRTRALVIFDWTKRAIFGRDSSRM
uniref:NADH:ubiquinone reductase (non-electrogenic) n=1 Tax=Araucaria cunninghamii TaxID=56994 RepID=A0A0D6R2N0_ARACU